MGLGAAHTVPSLLTTVCAAQSHQHSRPSPGGTSSPPPGAACLLGSVRRDAVLGGAPLISRGTFLASVWEKVYCQTQNLTHKATKVDLIITIISLNKKTTFLG